MQGREAVVVLHVDVHAPAAEQPGAQQLLDHAALPFPGGQVQGVVAVPARQARVEPARAEQGVHHGVAAPLAGVAQRREAAVVARVRVGARAQHGRHRARLVLDAGRVQRRQPVDAPSGQVGPFGDEEVDDRQVAVLRRHINGHHPIVLCLVDICSLVCQILDDVEVAHLAGGEQRADAVVLRLVRVHAGVLHQGLDDLKVAVLARLVQRRDPVVHGRVGALVASGPRADRAHHLGVAELGGHDDGRGRVALAQVRVHPLLAQVLHDLQPVVLAGHEEPRGAVRLLLVHVAASVFNHVLHDVQVSILTAFQERVASTCITCKVWISSPFFDENLQAGKLLMFACHKYCSGTHVQLPVCICSFLNQVAQNSWLVIVSCVNNWCPVASRNRVHIMSLILDEAFDGLKRSILACTLHLRGVQFNEE
mmetsp:Transcript_39941/g.66003  ORF Transcript_39941/g.66003 Transcript_39941/m.66003 type:complete len:423 (+) Transcript_39941:1932-3200(+)